MTIQDIVLLWNCGLISLEEGRALLVEIGILKKITP